MSKTIWWAAGWRHYAKAQRKISVKYCVSTASVLTLYCNKLKDLQRKMKKNEIKLKKKKHAVRAHTKQHWMAWWLVSTGLAESCDGIICRTVCGSACWVCGKLWKMSLKTARPQADILTLYPPHITKEAKHSPKKFDEVQAFNKHSRNLFTTTWCATFVTATPHHTTL